MTDKTPGIIRFDGADSFVVSIARADTASLRGLFYMQAMVRDNAGRDGEPKLETDQIYINHQFTN